MGDQQKLLCDTTPGNWDSKQPIMGSEQMTLHKAFQDLVQQKVLLDMGKTCRLASA